MGLYSVSILASAPAAGSPFATLRTGANPIELVYLGVFLTSGVGSQIIVTRPNNTPVATTSLLGQPFNPAQGASLTNIDNAWSTAPTISGGTPPFEGVNLPATAGAGIIWTWTYDGAIFIPANGFLVIWNIGGGAAAPARITARWRE